MHPLTAARRDGAAQGLAVEGDLVTGGAWHLSGWRGRHQRREMDRTPTLTRQMPQALRHVDPHGKPQTRFIAGPQRRQNVAMVMRWFVPA